MDMTRALLALGAGIGGIAFGWAAGRASKLAKAHRYDAAAKHLRLACGGFALLAAYNFLLRAGWFGWLLSLAEVVIAAMCGLMSAVWADAARRPNRPPRWDGEGRYP